jgi:hypothetical protein
MNQSAKDPWEVELEIFMIIFSVVVQLGLSALSLI